MPKVDKRRRNARPSKYRPRTESQRQRRKELWAAREADRRMGRRLSEEEALTQRLAELEAVLRDRGHVGVHNRRHVRPLDEIEDDAQRFAVLKARVERLEALWAINQRKRETRGKIIIGGALLAEAADMPVDERDVLLEQLVDILDRHVDRVRDRLTVRELLGNPPLALRPGGDPEEDAESALAAAGEQLPDFDAMTQSALAEAEDEDVEWAEIEEADDADAAAENDGI